MAKEAVDVIGDLHRGHVVSPSIPMIDAMSVEIEDIMLETAAVIDRQEDADPKVVQEVVQGIADQGQEVILAPEAALGIVPDLIPGKKAVVVLAPTRNARELDLVLDPDHAVDLSRKTAIQKIRLNFVFCAIFRISY